METTRHFTATVYVVNDGATALHEHDRLGIRIPPGGHVDRDELPHEAGLREVYEEIGLEATLLGSAPDVPAPDGRALPSPRYQMLYDIDVHEDGRVAHQHVDHLYFATVPSRDIDPAPGEEPPAAWTWYDAEALRESDLDADTVQLGIEAIEAADGA
ncbi:NUDIX domain-containing protein [Halobacterium wangiae]|uniref:NUDIX domain-containing protein n=1 Tax=Halobacterium wangiae TaxID=2902623 RepID=UPI001E40297E|nr:NUDIX domain-containing protein [Halobacterium wangiae]